MKIDETFDALARISFKGLETKLLNEPHLRYGMLLDVLEMTLRGALSQWAYTFPFRKVQLKQLLIKKVHDYIDVFGVNSFEQILTESYWTIEKWLDQIFPKLYKRAKRSSAYIRRTKYTLVIASIVGPLSVITSTPDIIVLTGFIWLLYLLFDT